MVSNLFWLTITVESSLTEILISSGRLLILSREFNPHWIPHTFVLPLKLNLVINSKKATLSTSWVNSYQNSLLLPFNTFDPHWVPHTCDLVMVVLVVSLQDNIWHH